MELEIARRVAAELGIHVEFAVREFWELAVLKTLAESRIGVRLVLKGGTALRLAYGSPRFSDDLDFAMGRAITLREFSAAVRRAARSYAELELTDLAAKRNTLLAEFRVRDAALERPFRLVIEVSRRAPGTTPSRLVLLSSPATPLTALLPVATRESVWVEKLAAIRSRQAPRDLFDLWFLAQQLKRALPVDLPRPDVGLLRRDLRKYLPVRFYPVVEELAR